jgi:hypothetical protein
MPPPFPLIGLGALQLAHVLDPADPQLRSRIRLAARLAVAVARAFGSRTGGGRRWLWLWQPRGRFNLAARC